MLKKITEDTLLGIIVRNWQLTAFGIGLLLSIGTLLNRIDSIDARVAAKADRESVDLQFRNLNEKITDIKSGVDYLIRVHTK